MGRKKKNPNEFTKLLDEYKYTDQYLAARFSYSRNKIREMRSNPQEMPLKDFKKLSVIMGVDFYHLIDLAMGEALVVVPAKKETKPKDKKVKEDKKLKA